MKAKKIDFSSCEEIFVREGLKGIEDKGAVGSARSILAMGIAAIPGKDDSEERRKWAVLHELDKDGESVSFTPEQYDLVLRCWNKGLPLLSGGRVGWKWLELVDSLVHGVIDVDLEEKNK